MIDAREKIDLDASKDLIMIVDDDQISSKLMAIMLKNMGFRTLCVEDGNCLTFSCEFFSSIKAILMDMFMPKMDGYKTTREIRKLFNQRTDVDYVPIIAVTVDTNKEKCLKAGCDLYLLKPISKENLAESLITFGLHSVMKQ